MKYFVHIMAALGWFAFVVGAAVRLLDSGRLLNASPVGWWRASIFCLVIGILYAVIDIRQSMKS